MNNKLTKIITLVLFCLIFLLPKNASAAYTVEDCKNGANGFGDRYTVNHLSGADDQTDFVNRFRNLDLVEEHCNNSSDLFLGTLFSVGLNDPGDSNHDGREGSKIFANYYLDGSQTTQTVGLIGLIKSYEDDWNPQATYYAARSSVDDGAGNSIFSLVSSNNGFSWRCVNWAYDCSYYLSRGTASNHYRGWSNLANAGTGKVKINMSNFYNHQGGWWGPHKTADGNYIYRRLKYYRCFAYGQNHYPAWEYNPYGCAEQTTNIYAPAKYATKEAHFSGKTSVSVNGVVQSGNSVTYTTDDADTQLVFTHTITRGDGDKDATITEYYYGEYSGSNLDGNFGGNFWGSANGGSSNKHWDSRNKGDKTSAAHSKTISLHPGESVTYCENIVYESYVKTPRKGADSSRFSRSTKKCVTIKRNPIKCSFNNVNLLGVTSGKNDATARINNNLTGVSASAGAGQTATNYARPGDSIQFTHDMCAATSVGREDLTDFKIIANSASSLFADSLVGKNDPDYNTKTVKQYAAGDFNNANGYYLSAKSPSVSADTNAPVLANGVYLIRSNVKGTTNFALDNYGDKKVNGNNIVIHAVNKSAAQRWELIYDKNSGYYRIQNANSNFSVDVTGAGIADETNVQLYQNNDSCAQRWKIVAQGSGKYRILNACSGKNLDVHKEVAADRTNVQIYRQNDSLGQLWSFERLDAGSSTGSTYSANTYSCDVFGVSSFKQYNYQIAGLSSNNSACNTPKDKGPGNYADVGKTISQTVSWNNDTVNADGSITSGGTATATAEVKVPYNYLALPYASLTGSSASSNVVYPGSSLAASAGVVISPRQNTAIGNSEYETYATLSKSSKVRLWTFYSSNSSLISSNSYTTSDLSGAGANAYLSRTFGARAIASSYSADNLTLNGKGNLSGNGADSTTLASGGRTMSNLTMAIPENTALGTKACIVAAVYPADSHNAPTSPSVNGAGAHDIAMSNSGNQWAVSAPVCKTVAKKPSMSVEGSNVFSSGPIKTAITDKRFGATNFRFGSWSEYGVYGAVAVTPGLGMASGAAFGYRIGNGGTNANTTRTNVDDNTVSTVGNTTTCTFSTQTFANSNCAANGGTVGTANLNADSVKAFKNRLEQHFTAGDAQEIDQSFASASTPNSGNKRCSQVGSYVGRVGNTLQRIIYPEVTCIRTNDNTRYLNAMNKNVMNSQADSNGITHVKFRGNGYYGAGVASTVQNGYDYSIYLMSLENLDNDAKNWTNVDEYIADNNGNGGTVVIDTDMVQGVSGDDDPLLSNISQVSKQIIVAKKVYITSRVKRIDAIIIADEVNTCAYHNYADFLNGKAIAAGTTDTSRYTPLSADNCNNEIVFNAPVLTKKLILNRTGGSNQGNGSIVRGEIFNLRMDTYLWSYAQMQRYSQAVITYSRELPTRY